MGHVVNKYCGTYFSNLRALPKNGMETFHFLHTKINSSRYSVPQTCPLMTYFGDVFTREDTLNLVSNNVKSSICKHLRNITLQRVPICAYPG
jgi:hypothetical protein